MPSKLKKFEHYEKRFGTIAIEKGFITKDQLVDALSVQVRENMDDGIHRLIGTILLDMDFMNADEIEETAKAALDAGIG